MNSGYAGIVRTLVLVFVTACWGGSAPSSQPTTPPPSTPEPAAPSSAFRTRPPRNSCRSTIDGMSDKLRPELLKTGIPESTVDELIEAAIESCRTMEWSSELLTCYDGIGDVTELNSCQKLMTTEQSDDVSRRMMDVVSRMSQQPPQPPPTP